MTVSDNQKAVVCIIILFVAGFLVARQTIFRTPPGAAAKLAYFYDLQKGSLYAQSSSLPGVRAFVFACGSCANEADRFTAYIQKITDESRAEMAKPEPNYATLETGQLIAAVEPTDASKNALPEPRWIRFTSSEGNALREAIYKKCQTPVACNP